MRKIRALLVEDFPANSDTIRMSLDLAFRQLGEWRVDWRCCGGAIEARQLVSDAEPFDFAIVDLHLGEGQPDGVSVGEDLHRRDPSTFVLLITGRTDEFSHLLSDRLRDMRLIIRGQLNDTRGPWHFEALAKRIVRHLMAHDRVPGAGIEYDPGDVRVLSLLEDLGGAEGEVARGLTVVRGLALKCLEAVETSKPRLRLGYLAPGRSGAHVCRVDLAEDGQPTQAFVLKIGLDAESLRAEVRANREAAKALREQALVSILGEVQSHSPYSAVIARIADRAETLASWLAGDPPPDEARALARMLFSEELIRLCAPELRSTEPVARWLATSAGGTLRVHAALDRALALLSHPKAAALGDAEGLRRDITAFVDGGELPVRTPARLSGTTIMVHGFGDLHASNVLVQGSIFPRPVLIDASHYGRRHWSADRARLLVDVVLRVRGAGLAALLWEDFDCAVRRAADLCPLCGAAGEHGTGPVDGFLDELVHGMRDTTPFEDMLVSEETWHWEWHVALAKEFLRRGCYADIEAPRRGLALVAAGHHLRRAGALVDELRF